MAINIPTITELRDRIKQGVEGALNISLPTFGKNFLLTFIGVQASKLKIFYLQLAKVQKNILPDTADSEVNGGTLERFGRIKLNRLPFSATAGVYTVSIEGTIGSEIQIGQTWKSNDDSSNAQKLFVIDSIYTVSGNDEIVLRALTIGSDGQLIVGDKLTSTSPIVGVSRFATVLSEDTVPLNAESVEAYREKIIEAYRLEPQGGAVGDYRLWAADAQGVRRLYPYAKNGESSSVSVYVEANFTDSLDGFGTPSQPILDDVASVLELDPDQTKDINERGRRPLGTLNIDVLPIVVLPVDITITGFQGLTTSLETLVESTIEQYLFTVRPFIAGADVLSNKNDVINSNNLSVQIFNALPQGSFFSTLMFTVDNIPQTSFQFLGGLIPRLNSITYI